MNKFPAFIFLSDNVIGQYINEKEGNDNIAVYAYVRDNEYITVDIALDTALPLSAYLAPCTMDESYEACFTLVDNGLVVFGLTSLLQHEGYMCDKEDMKHIQQELSYEDRDVVCFKFTRNEPENKYWGSTITRPQSAEEILIKYGDISGSHHKTWVINQALMANGIIHYANILVKTTGANDLPFQYAQAVGIAP